MDCRGAFNNCGVELSGGQPPVLHTTSALFRYKLNELLQANDSIVQDMQRFIEEQLLADNDTISLYLDPVVVVDDEGNSQQQPLPGTHMLGMGAAVQPESLIRLLLGVDALQTQVISMLLDKFPEFIGDEDSAPEDIDASSATKVSVKILRQLRWLDYIIDSGGLTEKLLETLGYVPPEMKSEIILALPDIISDPGNSDVPQVLVGMMTDTPELILSILETLGSLECTLDIQQQARNSVINQLVSAEPTDLPVMVRFLLLSVSADAATPVIQRIRKRLDMDSVILASKANRSRSTANQNPDVLVFDALATCLQSHKHLREAWLKLIASDTDQHGPHTTLDLVVLFVLHQITTLTKRVDVLIKNKIDSVSSQSSAYTPELFQTTISKFPEAFSVHFPSILVIASGLIRKSQLGSQASQVASSMIVASFGAMGMFQRQEISGELALHIGSGNLNEIDIAARTFLQIARQFPHELRPFAIFIKGLLDYVDNLSIEHIRVIFDTLGILSTLDSDGESGDGDSMFDDLYIFVRKQLSSVYPKYNQIGIVGTVALLQQLGAKDDTVQLGDSNGSGSSRLSQRTSNVNLRALRRAVQLLEMLVVSGRHQSWTFISMTYDELAHVVETKGLHPQLLTWLHENVSSTFAAQFLGDAETLSERYRQYTTTKVSNVATALYLDAEEPTILDILNHNDDAERLGLLRTFRSDPASDESDSKLKLRGSMLSCLPSLLRLIQVCEKALGDGSLNEIDALLVCGIYMLPSVDVSPLPPIEASTETTQFVEAKDKGTDGSLLISGEHLIGETEDDRLDLLVSLCDSWPVKLRRILCSSLFVTANWIRELINAFADQNQSELRDKVIYRVNQLSKIESDLLSVARSLKGTMHEFKPMAAGMVADMSESPVIRNPAQVGGIRIQPPPSAPSQADNANGREDRLPPPSTTTVTTSQHPQGNQASKVDIGGLLLSQDETRKLVDETFGISDLSSTATANGHLKKPGNRGRKRKGMAGSAGTTDIKDDYVENPRLFLRELCFSAFSTLSLVDDSSDSRKLSAHGLRLLLDELNDILATKLVRHTEWRVFGGPKHNTATGTPNNSDTQGTIATFGSNIAGSSATETMQKLLLPIFPSLLRYLTGCFVTCAHFDNETIDMSEKDAAIYRRLICEVDTPEDVVVAEACIDALLSIITTTLCWDGLQSGQTDTGGGHQDILTAVLGALAVAGEHTDVDELENIGLNVLVRRAFDYLLGLTKLIATSIDVLSIMRMLVILSSFAPPNSVQDTDIMDSQISQLAKDILSNRWEKPEDIKSTDLEYVITQHIIRLPHHRRVKVVHTYATKTLLQVSSGQAGNIITEDGEKDMLNRNTFPVYYKAITHALSLVIKQAPLSNNSNNDMSSQDLVDFAAKVSGSWRSLVTITQDVEGIGLQRSILQAALRGGCTLIDQLTKSIIPQLDVCFLTYRDDILTIFKWMQKTTRILQSICNHSKVAKDTKLQALVPQMKRKLEQFIFQVIELMKHNDCMGALDMGNLKHRDIRGQVVSSQIPRSPQESSEEGDEEMEDELGIGLDDDIEEIEEEEE